MRTPEAWLKQIEKLRAVHADNAAKCRWRENDTVRAKIITAWEGYHNSITQLLDRLGCATGTEHLDYTQPQRIRQLHKAMNFFADKTKNQTP